MARKLLILRHALVLTTDRGEQIGKAITQMEKVTQTIAANAEEGAAAAEELTAQSGTLKSIVDNLTALVG